MLPHALSQQTPAYVIKPLLLEKTQPELVEILTKDSGFLLKTLPKKYLGSVLKFYTKDLAEIDDDLADMYADTLVPDLSLRSRSTSPGDGEEINEVTYSIRNQHICIQEQRNVLSGQGGTGRRTWEAALALCEYLAGHVDELATLPADIPAEVPHFCELGAGTGLSGLFLAKYGLRATLTDGDDFVVQQLHHTIEANDLEEICFAERLFWGKDHPQQGQGLDMYTHVIAADVTYDPSIAPDLTECLRDFAQLSPAPKIIVSATIRDEDTYQVFVDECNKRNLDVVTLEEMVPPFETEYVFLDPTMAPKVIIAEVKSR